MTVKRSTWLRLAAAGLGSAAAALAFGALPVGAVAPDFTAQAALLGLPFTAEQRAGFERSVQASIDAQAAIEAADSMPFEAYRQAYLSPARLSLPAAA